MSNHQPTPTLEQLTAEMNSAFSAKQSGTVLHDALQPGHISGQPWSPELVITLTISIFSLAALILVMATFTMIYRKLSGVYALKLYTIVIIISFASFLCITGYDSNQLSSVFGLFGAIAGYLLGKEDNRNNAPTSALPPLENEKEGK